MKLITITRCLIQMTMMMFQGHRFEVQGHGQHFARIRFSQKMHFASGGILINGSPP